MKLSCECVRDILLCLEQFPFLKPDEDGMVEMDGILIEDLAKALPNYSEPDLLYTLCRLKEGGYINAVQKNADNVVILFVVTDMTFAGHELLERIRPETTWKKTLSILKKAGSFSLDLLSSVSGSILTAEASRWIAGG